MSLKSIALNVTFSRLSKLYTTFILHTRKPGTNFALPTVVKKSFRRRNVILCLLADMVSHTLGNKGV